MTAPVAAAAARTAAGSGGAGAGVAAEAGASRGAASAASKGKSGKAGDLASGAGLAGLLGDKRSKAMPSSSARKLLVAEFTLCMAVVAFTPLAAKDTKPASFMKRASALMGVFFVLGLVATAGRGASQAAAGFGGLVTLVLLISQRSIFTVLATKLGPGVGDDDGATEGLGEADLEDIGENVGDIIGDIADQANQLTPLPPATIGGAGMR